MQLNFLLLRSSLFNGKAARKHTIYGHERTRLCISFCEGSVPELLACSRIMDKFLNYALFPPTVVFCGFYKMQFEKCFALSAG